MLELPDIDFDGAAYTVAFIVYLIDKIVTYVKSKKKAPGAAFEEDSDVSNEISNILWSLLLDYSAVRVYLIQFHNGDKFYTGQDILKMTVTHEVWRTGQQKVRPSVNGTMVDPHTHSVAGELRKHIVAKFDEIDVIDDEELEARLQYLNVRSMYYYGIRDDKRRIVGMLCMHFPAANGMTDSNHQGVNHQMYTVSSLLSSGRIAIRKRPQVKQ